jgi:ubiquinone/menaquinone biosynthesis C-methylase UbiE
VPDAIFAHPRLAQVYDAFDDDRSDLDAYLAITDELGAEQVVDVGCGTGSLAVLLARTGRTVTGLDPAEASLAIARQKLGAESVTWINGEAGALPRAQADLALMTGNVAQVFLTDEEWSTTLHGVRDALRPGGSLVFETRRPGARAWEGWATDTDPEVREVPGVGTVERRLRVTEVALTYVSFRFTYSFASDGLVVTSDSTLRFRSLEEIERSLQATGFIMLEVRDAPDRPGLEYVVLARRG